MPNLLDGEKSLYLRQHKDNPVHWYPWGEAALQAAQAADKPLLVSIGYSACHWCHVMAHESFESEYIAGLMNKHFICVKVDREERPDVDQVYMEAVQMIQQQGGWPLNVFCLPDGRPFFGGTYFPPEDRGHGIVPWPQVLMRVADFYTRSKAELVDNAEAIQKNIMASAQAGATGDWSDDLLLRAVEGICGNHDDRYGGFGGAPKFPPAMTLNFLDVMRNYRNTPPELVSRIDEVRHKTLQAMAHGGIFDQFGGGFARYSVDAYWLIPHFEKMLYDNALLIEAYTRAWADRKEPIYAAVVEETIAWLNREMQAECGGYYAALDADSDGREGAYYVWTPEEVDSVLGPALAREIRAAYNITNSGNFEDGFSNPSLVEPSFSIRQKLTAARGGLRHFREANRSAPGKDRKINTAWNCLLIRAMAEAGFYFNRPDWIKNARAAADFIWTELSSENASEGRALHAVYYEGHGSQIPGFLHDYALAAEANLALAAIVDCFDLGASSIYRDRALAFLDAALDEFEDAHAIGWFFTAADAETPVARRKEWFDNAVPSGNSSMLHALSAAYALTGEVRYGEAFRETLPAYGGYAGQVASGVAHALEAICTETTGIAVIKTGQSADLEKLRSEIAKRSWRRVFIMAQSVEVREGGFQLCLGTRCLPPVDVVDELLQQFD